VQGAGCSGSVPCIFLVGVEITVLAVGKLRPFYREACEEYGKRLRRYLPVHEVEIREGRGGSSTEIERDEGRRMLEKVPDRAVVVALARDGTPWSSTDLASRLERWNLVHRPLVFLIGGSTGLGRDVLERAEQRWSLGPLTLPHELARVVVYEQLYRGFTILRGEPYHKGRS
jgi:23S rRNA (pseudouridine1915-N3)-methyltransferase